MAKCRQYEEMVEKILRNHPKTRDDDNLLMYYVWKKINKDLLNMSYTDILLNKDINLPNYNSVTRARRKLQKRHIDLMSTRQIQKLRKQEEQEYIEYSREK